MIKNIEWIKIRNARKIIDYANQADDFSKKELSERLDLSFSTVSTLVNLMEDRRILDDIHTPPTGSAGRSAKRYRLRKESIYCLSISFANLSLVTMALVNLRREIISRTDFILGEDWPETAAMIRKSYDQLLKESGISASDVVAAGVSIQGSYDAAEDALRYPYQSILDGVPLRAELKALLGLDAVIQNDIDTAAIYTARCAGQDFFIYLFISWQIGLGAVANGHLLQGLHGQSPEISHLPLGNNPRPCPACGSPNCLSASLCKGAILEQWYGHPFPPHPMGYEAQWQDFVLAVEREDPRALKIVEAKGRLLANVILTLFSLGGVRAATLSGIPEVLYRRMMPIVHARLQQWPLFTGDYRISLDPDAETTVLTGAMDAAFRCWYPALDQADAPNRCWLTPPPKFDD